MRRPQMTGSCQACSSGRVGTLQPAWADTSFFCRRGSGETLRHSTDAPSRARKLCVCGAWRADLSRGRPWTVWTWLHAYGLLLVSAPLQPASRRTRCTHTTHRHRRTPSPSNRCACCCCLPARLRPRAARSRVCLLLLQPVRRGVARCGRGRTARLASLRAPFASTHAHTHTGRASSSQPLSYGLPQAVTACARGVDGSVHAMGPGEREVCDRCPVGRPSASDWPGRLSQPLGQMTPPQRPWPVVVGQA